jgi:2'-5' RNA ligase
MPVFNFNIPIPKRSFFDELKPELPELWKPPQLELGPLPEMEQIEEPAGHVSVTPPIRDIRDVPSALKGWEMTAIPRQTIRRRVNAEVRTSTPPEATTGQEPASVFTEAPLDAARAAIRGQGGLARKISGYEAIANKLKTEKAVAAGGDVIQSRNLETQKVPVRFSVNIPQGTIGTAKQVKRAVLQGAGFHPDVVDQIEAAIGAPLLNWTPDERRQIEMTVNFFRKPVTKTMAEASAYKGKQLYRYSSETNVPRSAFAIYEAFMRGGPDAAREAYGMLERNVKYAPETRAVTEAERAAAKETYSPSSTGLGEALSQFGQSALKSGLAVPEGFAGMMDTVIGGDELTQAVRPFTEATQGFVERMMPVDPKNESWMTAKIPQAFGSTVPLIAGGALMRAPKLGAALLGAATNVQQVGQEFDVARAAQPYPDRFEGNRRLAKTLAAATGTLEAFGIEGRVAQFGTRSGLMKAVEEGLIGESAPEAFTDLLNDLNAVYGGGYDKKRSIGQSMLESFALGAVVGTGFEGASFLASKLADRRERLAYAAGVAQSQPDSPLGQVVQQAGVTPETISKADDRTIDEFTKRLEVWARAEAKIKQLQYQREQLAEQAQGAEARLQTGRVPTGPELQVADQVAQIDEQIAQIQIVQDETVAEIEEKVSPLFRRLRDAAQSELQAPSIGAEAPSKGPDAVTPPADQGQSPLFRRIAEAVAASQPAVESLTDVQEERPDLLKEVRREGGMAGDVEAGELRRIGQKEAGTTGLVQRTGLSPDEMRGRMVSEGLSQAETATDFIQEVEEELRRQKQSSRAETTYEDYARSQMSEGEREQSDRLDQLLTQPENPFTQAFRRLDNPKVPLSRELAGEFIEEAEREGFDDDFIDTWINEARSRRGIAVPAPVGTAPAQPRPESLPELERELEAVDRRIADKRSQGEETADDWAERRRIERQVEEITGEKFREHPKQPVPQEPAPPVRANVIPEWMRNRNVYRMGGQEVTDFVGKLREEKARQDAAGSENVDRGLWVTTRMMLEAAESRRAELKKSKAEPVPPLNPPRKPMTQAQRETGQKLAAAARKQVEAAMGAVGQTLTSERAAAELEAEQRLKDSPLARAVGSSPSDETKVEVADLGLESKTAPARPANAVASKRSVPIENITLGRDDLSRGRMNQVQTALAGGVKPEKRGVKLAEQIDAIEVVPDPERPGKWIVDNDGNHRVALLKLQGFKGDVPVTAWEAPTSPKQTEASVKRVDAKEGEEPRTVVHPNPAIDRKPVLAETQDGRVIVPNPENKGGVSVVKDRSGEEAEHKFSSTQMNLPKEIADKVIAFGKQIPDADLAEDGREQEPHITVKYGLHGADPKPTQNALTGEKPATVRFGKVSLFTSNPDFDVVKVEVESAGLRRLNKKVSESQPVTDTHPGYKPHVTVAYVKKGKGKRYVGNKFLEGRTVTLNSVVFSGRDGERVEIPLTPGKITAIPDDAMPELGGVFADLPARGSVAASDVASPAEHFYHSQTITKERGKRGALVYVNDHAKMILAGALEEVTGRKYYHANAVEVTRENLQKAVRTLEAEASANRRYESEILRVVEEWERILEDHPRQQSFTFHDVTEFARRREAAIPSDREAAARKFKQTSRHERVHWSQRQIVGGQGWAQVGSSWAQSTKGWGKYRRALLDRGYPDDAEILAAEVAAHVAAGQYDVLAARTEAEIAAAEEWLARYFERVADRYGIEALDKFGPLLEHAGRARERASTNVRTRQTQQSVGGAQAGAGAASGNRPPPSGGGGGGVQGGAPGGKRRPGEGPQGVRQEAPVPSSVPPQEWGEELNVGSMPEWQRGLGDVKSPARAADESWGAGQMSGRQPGLGRIKSPALSPDESVSAGKMPERQPGLGAVKSPQFSPSDPIDAGEMPEEQQALLETKRQRNAADFTRTAGDLWHLPKSLMSSADISAPGRQALFLTLPPTQWHRAMRAFGRQILSFKKANYDKFVKMLRADRAYRDAKAAGLYLASDDPKGGPISGREESFASEMAEKLPWVRWSEQAYKTYLDSLRLDTFAKYKRTIDKQFRDPGERFEAYQAAAEWINTSSGRGKFHGKFGQLFDNSVPFLNVFFYAPRYAVSRIQMLNPLTYARNLKSPQHRVVFRQQMSELFQSAAMLAATAALARAAGAAISFDDEDPDFLNIRWGSTRYDVLGGLKQVVRLAFGISRWAASELTEEDEKALAASRREQGKDALKYLRGKLSPLMGFMTDWFNDWTAITGERHAPGDFMTSFGEGDYAKMADDIANDPAVSQALPMLAADLVSAWYNGYRNTGDPIGSIGRAAKVLPAGLGVGVADYDRPEYSKPVRKALKEYGIEPRYPKKDKYETEKEYETRIPLVIQDQAVVVQEFQSDQALKEFPKDIQREVLSDALSENGRERMKKLKPEWVHKDWQTQAIIEEWKRDMEQNPVFKQLSGEAKKAAMASFAHQMSKFRAKGGERPKPPRPFSTEMVRKIIAKSLNQ